MPKIHEFLLNNKDEILALTEEKTLELAGARASSAQLKQGLPIFFQQLLGILLLERPADSRHVTNKTEVQGANDADEATMALAAGRPEDARVAEAAALHGTEMLRLGYTLSHVVHAYGAMCQAITELANKKDFHIDVIGFHDLNQCLDVAIAGAVTEYQRRRDLQERSREDEHLGSLTHELRNALTNGMISFQMIKRGTVGVSGNTGTVLEKSLQRMQKIIDRSLTEVRLRVDPVLHIESSRLIEIVDQILVTAELEAQAKKQKIELDINSDVEIVADQQTFYSALSNLIQNALKFTHENGTIRIRGRVEKENVIVEVHDECGGLPPETIANLFKAFEQQNENRTGLGLGLAIARRAITLNHGIIEAHTLPGKGCIFTITLPRSQVQSLAPGLKSTVAEKSDSKSGRKYAESKTTS